MYKLLKTFVPVILVLFCSVCIVGPAWGEALQQNTPDQLKINQAKYDAEKKDPDVAVNLSFLLPSYGHYYAGDWGRGVKFLLIDTAILGLTIYSIGQSSSISSGQPVTNSFSSMLAALFVGCALGLLSHIWEAADVRDTVDNYNKQLKKKYGLSLNFNINSVDVRYSYHF